MHDISMESDKTFCYHLSNDIYKINDHPLLLMYYFAGIPLTTLPMHEAELESQNYENTK